MPAILETMEGHARRASQASIKTRLELAVAMSAPQTQTQLSRALKSQTALATRAILGLMEAHARCVSQASTRMRQDPAAATTALHTPTRHPEAP